MSSKEQKVTNISRSHHLQLKRMKSAEKQVFSMNLRHRQKLEEQERYSLTNDKKIRIPELTKIQNKIEKYVEMQKNKNEKTKQHMIKLERYRHPTEMNLHKNSDGKNSKRQAEQNQYISYRKKDCYVLQRGRNKPVKLSHSVNGLIKGSPNQNSKKEKLQISSESKIYELHPQLKGISNFSESISTNQSRSSFKDPKLADFDVGQKLGQGKYGKVFIARHKKSGMFVALKKIQKNKLDFCVQKQIIQEIKIQLFVQHPNVVKLYSFFSDQKWIYLVIELFISGQLFSFLQRKGRIEELLAKSIVKQICQGVKHLHKNNIIHRDIKLENILYQMGMVKICDFGWSIQTQDYRQTFCGTPLYLSPQILQQKGYDNKIDIWSIGVLTYQLLFGKVPFQINSQLDFAKIVYEDVKFPSTVEVSDAAKNFIQICLIKDPVERANAPALLIHPFLKEINEYQGSEMF